MEEKFYAGEEGESIRVELCLEVMVASSRLGFVSSVVVGTPTYASWAVGRARIERTTEGWLLVYGSQRYTLTPSDNSLLLDQHTGRTVVVDGFFEGIEGVDGATGTPRFILHGVKAA